jgi:hypothetical protein
MRGEKKEYRSFSFSLVLCSEETIIGEMQRDGDEGREVAERAANGGRKEERQQTALNARAAMAADFLKTRQKIPRLQEELQN